MAARPVHSAGRLGSRSGLGAASPAAATTALSRGLQPPRSGRCRCRPSGDPGRASSVARPSHTARGPPPPSGVGGGTPPHSSRRQRPTRPVTRARAVGDRSSESSPRGPSPPDSGHPPHWLGQRRRPFSPLPAGAAQVDGGTRTGRPVRGPGGWPPPRDPRRQVQASSQARGPSVASGPLGLAKRRPPCKGHAVTYTLYTAAGPIP